MVFYSASFAAETPLDNIVNEGHVSVSALDILEEASYDASSDNLVFVTKDEISVIQIFDANGNLEFQLPVMSNQVKINKNLFGEGRFKLGFLVEGDSQIHLSDVIIK